MNLHQLVFGSCWKERRRKEREKEKEILRTEDRDQRDGYQKGGSRGMAEKGEGECGQ